MNKQIKTSVIIPIYNTEKYLDDCIQSVLKQTQKEIEIILVDDGSTDGSADIIDEYADKYENILVIHQENQKLGAARNNGVKIAKGKYVYFLDSDDYIAGGLLEKCYNHAEKRNLDFLFFDAYSFYDEGDKEKITPDQGYDRSGKNIECGVLSGKEYWRKYVSRGGIISCAQFTYIKREYIVQNNLFFQEGIFYEDMDWIVRMYICADRVSYYPQKLYYRRYRPGAITQSAYTNFHFFSTIRSFWVLIDLYLTYDDAQATEMIEFILMIMYRRIGEILKEIDVYSVQKELRLFVKDFFEWEHKLIVLGEKIYYEIFRMMKLCKKNIVNGEDIGAENEYHINQLISVKNLKNQYRLNEKIKIGIYGVGQRCDEIFDWHEEMEIPISADIKLIVSNAEEESVYRGYPIIGVQALKGECFDHIIIASIKFAEEMKKSLKENQIVADSYFVTINRLGEFYE